MACLSIRQIEQIENGESSTFYSDQVKFTAAKKVASLLKLKPEDAFDFGSVQAAATASEVQENLKEDAKVSALEKKTKPEKTIDIEPVKRALQAKDATQVALAKVSEAKSKKVTAGEMPVSTPGYSVNSKFSIDPKKKIFFLIAIGAAVIFSVINLRPLFFPEPVKEELVVIQEIAQEVPPVSAPAEPAVDASPVPVIAVGPAISTLLSECPPADGPALNYKPDAPKKAGDSFYLQSKAAQTLCVVDAAGKIQNKTLESGAGVSISGKPPFKVLTGGLNQVDLYYQGVKVRIGSTGSKTIILEPAEIIQTTAPSISSDSQLR